MKKKKSFPEQIEDLKKEILAYEANDGETEEENKILENFKEWSMHEAKKTNKEQTTNTHMEQLRSLFKYLE